MITNALLNLRPSGVYAKVDDLLQLRFGARNLLLFARRPATSLLAGGKRTRFRGRGIDFEEVRLYHPGDDIRAIDWRVTARTQVPHTKLFSEERERPVFVCTDLRSPMFFGTRQCFKSVLACHLASSLSWAALANSDRVGGLVFGDSDHRDIRPKRSKHSVLEIIQQLNLFGTKLKQPFSLGDQNNLFKIFENSRRLAKPGSAIFIISDFHDFNEDCERQLFQLSRHCDVTLFHVIDPMEKSLPATGQINITDGQQRRLLNAQDARFAAQYQQQASEHLQRLQQSCQKYNVALASFSTDSDPQQQLRELYSSSLRRTKNR